MDFKPDIRTQNSTAIQQLKNSDRKSRDLAKLKEAAQEFEAIFINEMYKTARKTISESGLFEKSNAEKIFEEMLDMERSRQVSRNSNMGIADQMYRQMAKAIENRK